MCSWWIYWHLFNYLIMWMIVYLFDLKLCINLCWTLIFTNTNSSHLWKFRSNSSHMCDNYVWICHKFVKISFCTSTPLKQKRIFHMSKFVEKKLLKNEHTKSSHITNNRLCHFRYVRGACYYMLFFIESLFWTRIQNIFNKWPM